MLYLQKIYMKNAKLKKSRCCWRRTCLPYLGSVFSFGQRMIHFIQHLIALDGVKYGIWCNKYQDGAHYCACINICLFSMAVRVRNIWSDICTDEKRKISIEEPRYPLSALPRSKLLMFHIHQNNLLLLQDSPRLLLLVWSYAKTKDSNKFLSYMHTLWDFEEEENDSKKNIQEINISKTLPNLWFTKIYF